jgi:hypothetical protein
MRLTFALGIVLVFVAAGCGGGSTSVVVTSTPMQLEWASLLGAVEPSDSPIVAATIRREAAATGAKVLDVTMLASRRGGAVALYPAVILQANDPAAYLKHRLKPFLDAIHYGRRSAYVEVVDAKGALAWEAGAAGTTGMVHIRPDLDACSPIQHGHLATRTAPPACPAT